MTIIPITFQLVPGLRRSPLRAVGFLDGDPDLAWNVFLNLPQRDRDFLMIGMGLWIDRTPLDRRHHGFHGDYSDCHVFKHVHKKHRFYGFKYRPQEKTAERFQLCIVTTYAFKPSEMDPENLNRVHQWRDSPAAKRAIALIFPDVKERTQ